MEVEVSDVKFNNLISDFLNEIYEEAIQELPKIEKQRYPKRLASICKTINQKVKSITRQAKFELNSYSNPLPVVKPKLLKTQQEPENIQLRYEVESLYSELNELGKSLTEKWRALSSNIQALEEPLPQEKLKVAYEGFQNNWNNYTEVCKLVDSKVDKMVLELETIDKQPEGVLTCDLEKQVLAEAAYSFIS